MPTEATGAGPRRREGGTDAKPLQPVQQDERKATRSTATQSVWASGAAAALELMKKKMKEEEEKKEEEEVNEEKAK